MVQPSSMQTIREYTSELLNQAAAGYFESWDEYWDNHKEYQDLILGFLDAWFITCKARRTYARIQENGEKELVEA